MEVSREPVMNSANAISTDQFSQMSEFESIRQEFVEKTNLDVQHRPISHWARQGDRRLPYALLRYTVSELINTPFADLASTPGIGPKKISSMLNLLRRALDDRQSSVTSAFVEKPPVTVRNEFNADSVSESAWEDWRQTVRDRGLENQMIGQLTPTLQDLPTVIWKTVLGEYLNYSLAELRALKTHGEKRIQVVLEVFFIVHSFFKGAGCHPRFSILVRPGFVPPIEQWIQGELESEQITDVQEIRENLTLPLLNQIQADGGDTVHQLASGRLGIEGEPESVRRQAERLDVTRARVYQLLETCAEIMRIRWPEGRHWLAALAAKIGPGSPDNPKMQLFESTRWLMFPERVDQRIVANVLPTESVEDRVSS